MTKDEALKMALEALEESLYATTAKSQFLAFEALTAIKEALAQPAQERQWVGLTGEDFSEIKFPVEMRFPAEFRAGARWAEDKLKQKNT